MIYAPIHSTLPAETTSPEVKLFDPIAAFAAAAAASPSAALECVDEGLDVTHDPAAAGARHHPLHVGAAGRLAVSAVLSAPAGAGGRFRARLIKARAGMQQTLQIDRLQVF